MACKTRKTLLVLKIAETLAGKGKRILFFVLSLFNIPNDKRMTADTEPPLRFFSVCSDTQVSKPDKNQDSTAMDT